MLTMISNWEMILFFSIFISLLIGPCTGSATKQPEYVQVNISGALEHFSGVYKVRKTKYGRDYVYQKTVSDYQKFDCGCKCQVKNSYRYIYGDKWCYVHTLHASCGDLIPSDIRPNKPWSKQAVTIPSDGDSRCPEKPKYPNYSLLYKEYHLDFWKIENVFKGGKDLRTVSEYSSFFDLLEESQGKNKWKVTETMGFKTDVYVSITPCNVKGKNPCKFEPKPDSLWNIVVVVGVSLGAAFLILICSVIVLFRRKNKKNDDQKIDENPEYGDDLHMYSIRDHRVVDNNEYYE